MRRAEADVLEHEKQQAVLELEVEDHVGLAKRAAVLRGGSGHGPSLVPHARARKR